VIWYVVIALAAGSLLVLGVAAALLLRRLGALGIAVRRLRLRLDEAQRLMPKIVALQQEVTAVQERAELLQHALAGQRDGRTAVTRR
jgi:hypothetical protein